MSIGAAVVCAMEISADELQSLVDDRWDSSLVHSWVDRGIGPVLYTETRHALQVTFACSDDQSVTREVGDTLAGRFFYEVDGANGVGEEIQWKRHETGRVWVKWYCGKGVPQRIPFPNQRQELLVDDGWQSEAKLLVKTPNLPGTYMLLTGQIIPREDGSPRRPITIWRRLEACSDE